MSASDVLWLAWLVLFVLIEIPAVLDSRKGNTFSEKVWWFLGIGQRRTRLVQLRRFFGLAFGVWLLVHFLTGGWV